jgi:hypothetical protein
MEEQPSETPETARRDAESGSATPVHPKGCKSWLARGLRRWKRFAVAIAIAATSYVSGIYTAVAPQFRAMAQHLLLSRAGESIVHVITHPFRHGEKRWRVLAVFPDSSSSTVSVPILDALGFKGGVKVQQLADGVDFVYVPEERTLEETAAVLRMEIEKNDVLLIVGHITSTAAQYLDNHVYHAEAVVGDTPMPLVLPAATNPLITSSEPMGHEHILRLPATDIRQVACLRAFVVRLMAAKREATNSIVGDESVGVLRDRSNPTYSDYIGDELVAQSDNVDQSVGADLGGSDIPESLWDHDVVVVAGMERLSKVILRRLHGRRVPIGIKPEFVFTDGVAGEVFYKATGLLLAGKDRPNQHVWMSGPFEPRDQGGTLYAKGEQIPDKPNYYSYGVLAKIVMIQLLQDTRQHNKRLSRAAVLDTLRSWLKNKFSQPQGVEFDSKGDNQKSDFHVYRIGATTYAHAKYCCCDSK